MSLPAKLNPQEEKRLKQILLEHPYFSEGPGGIRSILEGAGFPKKFIQMQNYYTIPALNADSLLARIGPIQTLINKEKHSGLGALVEFLLDSASSREDQLFLSYLLTHHRLIWDREYLQKLADEYGHFSMIAKGAEPPIDLGWNGMQLDRSLIDFAALESIVRPRVSFLDTIFLSTGAKACSAVCRIETAEHVPRAAGTGFLVAPDLILTNYHVIPQAIRLENGAQARFNYRKDRQGLTSKDSKAVRIVKEIASSPVNKLDYCLLQLESPMPETDPLTFASAFPERANMAIIVQHPEGDLQKFVMDHSCVVAKSPADTGRYLYYFVLYHQYAERVFGFPGFQ